MVAYPFSANNPNALMRTKITKIRIVFKTTTTKLYIEYLSGDLNMVLVPFLNS